jgi:hypothetical protein
MLLTISSRRVVHRKRWLLLLRVAVALGGGYLLSHAMAMLGTALPLSRIDAGLTTGLISGAIYIPLLFWALGATVLMRQCAAVLLPGALLIAAILLLPWNI